LIKILAPVDRVEEVEKVIEAGADELYCGVLSRDWIQKYTLASLNRRPAPACNFKSFEDLRKCIEIAHSHGVPVALTINEHYYVKEQYPLLLRYFEDAVNAGVDSFIISDLGILMTLQKMNVGVKIHISTGGTTFNSETVKFYQDLGASRVQLDRHLTIEEIKEICKETVNIEMGVFILNSRCANIDGFCTFLHFFSSDPLYTNACMLPYEVYVESPEDDERKIVAGVRQKVWQRFHIDDRPCGACALHDFNEMGLSYVKIVGRGNSTSKKILDVNFINTLRSFLGGKSSKREFQNMARKLYSSIFGRPCRIIMCYYPDVVNEWNEQYI
jgi:collagenase-like PrtC family protease